MGAAQAGAYCLDRARLRSSDVLLECVRLCSFAQHLRCEHSRALVLGARCRSGRPAPEVSRVHLKLSSRPEHVKLPIKRAGIS
ncbi:hypothetical protein FRC08_010201 [Ceratobasidium sp. 394]|nr:hypothetical protein FRC08_010201 [Ceratobasidium sp. 394]